MKILKFLIIITLLLSHKLFSQNTNPVVSNVNFSITGQTVTVTYDVSDDQPTVNIALQVINEQAIIDWDESSVQGDYGDGIGTGTGKTITFTYTGGLLNNIKMRVIADDNTAGGSPCPGATTVSYEGQTYNTIQIGTQCWFRENLNIGTWIQSSNAQTDNRIIEKYCFNNSVTNCNIYGGLYQWSEATKYISPGPIQGICPNGWRLPNIIDIDLLKKFTKNSSNKLKATSQGSGAGSGTNVSGFSMLLSGYYDDEISDTFKDINVAAYLWTTTAQISKAYAINLLATDNDIYYDVFNKNQAFSIRCIKE